MTIYQIERPCAKASCLFVFDLPWSQASVAEKPTEDRDQALLQIIGYSKGPRTQIIGF